MVLEMSGLLRPYGFLFSRDSVGGSVARAREAKVSMIRFTHNICTAFRGESWRRARRNLIMTLRVSYLKSGILESVLVQIVF